MFIKRSVEIDAPAATIWAVMEDVERWPEWTASMQSVARLDSGPFGPGSRVRIRQPRVPALTWQVTEFDAGRAFCWEARSTGQRHLATHRIEPRAGGGCTVTLTARSTGLMVTIFAPLIGPMSRRYVAMEAEGLKRRSESMASSAPP